MTETPNLPAVRIAPELDQFARVGKWLAAAESTSRDPEAVGMRAALRLYLAAQLGLSPLAAAELSLIDGRLVVSAKLLRGLAFEQGYRVVPVVQTPLEATAAVIEIATGEELGRVTFTEEDARAAGLLKDEKPGAAWTKWRGRMLWARAAKFAIDDYAPHVSVGLLVEEEAQEISGAPLVPAPETGGVRPDPADAPAPSPGELEEEAVALEDREAEALEEAVEDEELRKARANHFGYLGRLEDGNVKPPEGFETWEAVSRQLFGELWPELDSRAELDVAQWRRLTQAVENQGGEVPF